MKNRIILKFPARVKAALCVTALAGLSYQAVSLDPLILSGDSSLSRTVRVTSDGLIRSYRAISSIALTVSDYKFSLRGLRQDSDEYRRVLSEVHLRSAKRMLKLCEMNKGFYVKAGQFVSSMRQIPKEYSLTLSSLQDQAVPCDFISIQEVVVRNLGQNLSEIFNSFDEKPIAAASIAQVHHAILKDGQEVAVKVQYPGLDQQMQLDTRIMSLLESSVAWIFPDYRFGWLVSEFFRAISSELDFIQEARNSEKTADNFKYNRRVKVPCVFWGFTTNRILTMEFCSGHKIDDMEFLHKSKISPEKVAKALMEVFSEMIFIHGFLHGDPHPGNILVSVEREGTFSLVILDHGSYRKFDEGFRLDYCELWRALIFSDFKKIHQISEKFGVGKYSRFLPVILTGRTIDSKSGIGSRMSTEEEKKLKQDLRTLRMEDVSTFMESLPDDFLTILRTDGLLRSAISNLGASKQVRLLAYAKYAILGLSAKSDVNSGFPFRLYSKLRRNMTFIRLRLAVAAIELRSWTEKLKKPLYNFYRKVGSLLEVVLASTSRLMISSESLCFTEC